MNNERYNFIINNIYPEYQPIVDLMSNKKYPIVKFEALVRSKDVNGKILYPDFLFNHIDNRIITKIMFEKVIRDIKRYGISVSFNISLSDIENKEIINKIFNILEKHQGIGKKLTFEFVEEEEIVKNKFLVQSFIKEIHSYNAEVALDDFGKGYATFEPILEFDFDIIKFDKVLVNDFLNNPVNYYLINNLIEMFNALDKKVVAEYVEKKEELDALKYISCMYAQGYYISPPKKIESFVSNIYKI